YPISIAKEHTETGDVSGCQIRYSILVEVTNGNRPRGSAGGIHDRRMEGAVAIAQQNAHPVVPGRDYRQVGLPVTIQIVHRDRGGVGPDVVAHGRLQSAIGVPQQHSSILAGADRGVQLAVRIEVTHAQLGRSAYSSR